LKVFSVTFPGFAKNGAPHELTVNTDQIEGRAPVRASKKASRNEEKNGLEMKTKKSWILVSFWVHFGRFWEHFRAQKPSENQCRFRVMFFCDYGALRRTGAGSTRDQRVCEYGKNGQVAP
jgi:hypothetical protein